MPQLPSDARPLPIAMLVLGSLAELAGVAVLFGELSLPLGVVLVTLGLALTGAGVVLLAQSQR